MSQKIDQSPARDVVSNLTPAAVLDLATQYQHRLLSLEAELRDHAMHMSKRVWKRRMRSLNRLHEQLHSLRMACAPAARSGAPKRDPHAPSSNALDDLGLPLSAACTPVEVDLCEKYVAEKLKFTGFLERQAHKVLSWTRQTVAGKGNWLLTTWRLSRMRRMIEDVETRTRQVLADCAALDSWIEQFVRAAARDSKSTARDVIDGLIMIFSRLEEGVTRVARLRAALRTEQGRLAQMEAWMARRGFDRDPVVARPPTPLAALLAREEIPLKAEVVSREKNRLTLARRLIGAMASDDVRSTLGNVAAGTGAWQVGRLTSDAGHGNGVEQSAATAATDGTDVSAEEGSHGAA